MKISVIGAGAIGGQLAYLLALKDGVFLQLIDIDEGRAKGKCLDISHAITCINKQSNMNASSSFEDLKGSDVIVITAGFIRTPNMTRQDLLAKNANVINDIANNIKKYAPYSFVIVVTNPLDIMAWLFYISSGLPSERVVGMAGMLDSSRFRFELARALNVDVHTIQSQVIGSHDDLMLPLISHTTVSGVPLSQFVKIGRITEDGIANVIHNTKKSGGIIVEHLKNQSAFMAPAQCILTMIDAFVFDQKRLMTCSVYAKNITGKDQFIGLPCIISGKGVEEVVPLELNELEEKMFAKCVENIEANQNMLKETFKNNSHG